MKTKLEYCYIRHAIGCGRKKDKQNDFKNVSAQFFQ